MKSKKGSAKVYHIHTFLECTKTTIFYILLATLLSLDHLSAIRTLSVKHKSYGMQYFIAKYQYLLTRKKPEALLILVAEIWQEVAINL